MALHQLLDQALESELRLQPEVDLGAVVERALIALGRARPERAEAVTKEAIAEALYRRAARLIDDCNGLKWAEHTTDGATRVRRS